MSGLLAKMEEVAGSGTFVDMSARFTNSVGAVLFSCVANDQGEGIAGLYVLTASSVVAGVSATITVAADSPNNPYDGRVVTGVLLDESTVRSDIVPGCDLKFDNACVNTNHSQVRVGHSFGSVAAFPPAAGIGAGQRRIQVVNTGAATATGCKARIINRAKLYKKTGTVFARVRPFAEAATEKLTTGQVMPYLIEVSGVAGSGAAKTMDLDLDGAPIATLTNLTDLTTSDSTGLNVVDYFRVEDGLLEGLEFILSEDAVNSDSANLLVFSPRFLQIAPDTGAAPGIWGSADVDLTESGEAVGSITASGLAYFWARTLVPDGGNSLSNPYPLDICLSGVDPGSAGWDS